MTQPHLPGLEPRRQLTNPVDAIRADPITDSTTRRQAQDRADRIMRRFGLSLADFERYSRLARLPLVRQ